VLGRVAAIADAPATSELGPDAHELRQRTFLALREMLARLGDRSPLVIWIDDLQWGDRDSSSFLAELCAFPTPPRLLLLLSYRSEESDTTPTLDYLNRVFSANERAPTNWRHLNVEGLNDEDSRKLLKKLLSDRASDSAVEKIVSEARGHPFYLQELARWVSRTGKLSQNIAESDLELRAFLQRRISELPMSSRDLLELISLAAQPITLSMAFAAAVTNQTEDQRGALSLLIDGNLIRISGGDGEKRVEPYHDQVRKVVVDALLPEKAKARHARLAQTLADNPSSEPQLLVTHYTGAGDLSSALSAALKAASAAENQLAFERAAMFYQAALDTGTVGDSYKADLYHSLATCLGNAGRGWDSAHAYLKAAEFTENDAFELSRLAADQLLRSGYLDQAMVLFRKLCRRVDVKMPANPRSAIRGIVFWRLLTRIRLMFGYPESYTGFVAPKDVARLDVLRTGGIIMNTADPVIAAYFQARHIYDSLHVREPDHLATAFALEASFRAVTGVRRPEKCLELMQIAEQLAKKTSNSSTLGFVYLCRAYLDHILGRVPQGIENSRFAISFLRRHCTGVAWELTAAHVLLFWFTFWAGHMDEVRELFPQLLREGAARGDANVEDSLRFLSYFHLSADRPQDCLRESRRILESQRAFHLQHYVATLTYVETHLYMGEYALAREHLLKAWSPMSKSHILRSQILRILAFFLRGRVAMACWFTRKRDSRLRAEVEYYAKRLKRIRSAWCEPMTCLLLAGLAAGEGNRAGAVRALEEAHNGFERIALHGYASATAYVSGHLRGDEKGVAQVRMAEEFFKVHDFRNPESFLRMLIPGRWW
jgi:tetratricopeptide (TPR) repeat protein